jgi:hypothetical protein
MPSRNSDGPVCIEMKSNNVKYKPPIEILHIAWEIKRAQMQFTIYAAMSCNEC